MAGGAGKQKSELFIPLRWPLSDGRDDVYFFRLFEPIPDDYVLLPELSETELTHYLRRLAEDPLGLQALREIVLEEGGLGAGEAHTKDELPALVAHWIATRRLRLAKAPVWPWPKLEPFAPELFVRAPAPVAETGVFSVLVVDDLTDDPMPNVKLHVKLPDGSEKDVVTDSSGRVDLAKVSKGRATLSSVVGGAKLTGAVVFVKTGAVSSQPQAAQTSGGQSHGGPSAGASKAGGSGGGQEQVVVLRIVERKVKTGDSLATLATEYGIAADDITDFNWQTTKPEEVNQYLYAKVGCRKRSANDQKFIFDSADRPGVVLIPQPITLSSLALDQLHILRVKKRSNPPAYSFSA
jgi:hypothetical protein